MIVRLFIFLSLALPALGSIVLEQFPVSVNFDRNEYLMSKPATYGTRGTMLLLKNKQGTHTFSLTSAGFISSKKEFFKECDNTQKEYAKMGGKISQIKIDKKKMKCSFNRQDTASFDMIEINYDSKNYRAYIFSGLFLNKELKKIKHYKKEFRKLASGIVYNIEA